MKTIASFFAIAFCFSLSAQNNDISLQESLNKSLNKQKTKIENFEANVNLAQNAVQLKWEILPENNTAEFIIEKSTDRSIWQPVASVYGAEHKSHEMEFIHMDYEPLEDLSFYRLIQKDDDGNEISSNIVPVKYFTTENNSAGLNLSPTLSENNTVINIAFEEIFDKEILLVIRDKKGNEFYSKVVINIEDETLVAVPIESEVPKGDYLITATSENQIYSQNIVIK